MDGTISFIIKRFFYSFLSGCVIIFYGVIYYYVLKGTSTSHPFLFDIILSFIRIYPPFVFVIVSIILSIIIEGICQIGLELYLPLYDKEKKYTGKTCKDFKTCRGKCEYLRYKTAAIILEFIYIRPSILWVSKKKYYKYNDFNPMEAFINDSDLKEPDFLYFNCNLNYNAVYICARVIEGENKINNIYNYRDYAYIMQMLRLSFFCIALITVISGIVFHILGIMGHWTFNNVEGCNSFFKFILVAFLISIFFFFVLTVLARSFAKRFIREVGYTYEAMKLKLPINKNGVSSC